MRRSVWLVLAWSLGCAKAPPAETEAPVVASAESAPAQTALPPSPVPSSSAPSGSAPASESKELRVGAVTDGATLIEAEVLELGALPSPKELRITGASLTLEFDGAGEPPVTTAKLSEDARRVVLIVSGVRQVTADLPLVTGEGGSLLRAPKPIDLGPVRNIGRTFLGDDSAIQIELELSAPVRLELVKGARGRSVTLRMHARE